LAHQQEQEGQNLYQLLRAMNRFLPLLPSVPNLAAQLGTLRSGHLQARENIRRDFLKQVETLFNDFLAGYIEESERAEIWDRAAQELNEAFSEFSVEGQSSKALKNQQSHFKRVVDETLRELLLDSLSALDPQELVEALQTHISTQQENWRKKIGNDEYQNFQRLLLLSAIDNEWRDYLTAMDDLRREIGLEAFGQRDPKVEYKRRSFQMFADMRHNIDQSVVDRFFRELHSHQDFIQRQEATVAYQEQMSQAGYQMVQRDQGKGVELRREMPKVGRNDPCPCGSGKKYKHCHLRQDRAAERRSAKRARVSR
jgi:preprotein translocase subunit SecA